MSRGGMFSHQPAGSIKVEWITPPEIVFSLGLFDLDPCAPVAPPHKLANRTFTEHGLQQPWNGRVWCNPPYGKETGKWIEKCSKHGNAIALIYARTETSTWFDWIWPLADSVFFFKGRIHFCHVDGTRSKTNSGAPSALIAYGRNNVEAIGASGLSGKHIILNTTNIREREAEDE